MGFQKNFKNATFWSNNFVIAIGCNPLLVKNILTLALAFSLISNVQRNFFKMVEYWWRFSTSLGAIFSNQKYLFMFLKNKKKTTQRKSYFSHLSHIFHFLILGFQCFPKHNHSTCDEQRTLISNITVILRCCNGLVVLSSPMLCKNGNKGRYILWIEYRSGVDFLDYVTYSFSWRTDEILTDVANHFQISSKFLPWIKMIPLRRGVLFRYRDIDLSGIPYLWYYGILRKSLRYFIFCSWWRKTS